MSAFSDFASAEARGKVLMDGAKSSTYNIVAAHAAGQGRRSLRESPARHELVSDSCFGRSTRCESEKLGRAYRRRRGVSGRQTRGKIYDQEDGLHTSNPDFNA